MINEVIILAGGLGTRLRSVVTDLPKCMAPVAGNPFLYYVIKHLQNSGIDKFIFSVGYKNESILQYVKKEFADIDYKFSIEEEPLGTGGAIKFALKKTAEENILVCNGDTLFKINTDRINNVHFRNNADCTLSLKPMKNFDRYGVVELCDDGLIHFI